MKRHPTILIAVLAIFMMSAPNAYGEFSRNGWQYHKAIYPPETPGAEYAFFQVDAEVYDGSADRLQSLRIIDGVGNEIPYQISTRRAQEKREEFWPTLLNKSYVPDAYNSFVLDIGAELPKVNEVEILIGNKEFMRSVSVEGSSDQSNWNILVDRAYIFNLPNTLRRTYTRVGFPLSNFRFLRIKVLDDGSGPLDISGAKLFKVQRENPETEQWPLTITSVTQNDEDKTTEIVADAGYRGLPINEIEVAVVERNYYREITVSSSRDREEWKPLGTDTIFNYDLPQFKKSDDKLTVSENIDGRYLKLVIKNYDDRPLDITGITGVGLIRRVVFALRGTPPYQAYFGAPKTKQPRYDLARHVQYLQTQQLPQLVLGPRMTNPDYKEPVGPWSEEHAYLLWVIIGAAVIVLGLLIFNLAKKTGPEDEEADDGSE